MERFQAQRRLVKSPPELWSEVSSEPSLARRLAHFGEIRITRVEPQTTVAWEGERASGTVQLTPTGWGTTVTLTATPARRATACEAPAQPAWAQEPVPAAPPPNPEPAAPPASERAAGGLFARLFRRRRPARVQQPAAPPDPGPPAPGPEPPPPDPDPAPTPRAPALDEPRAQAVLAGVLDDLGAAHHRPFSRD